MTAWSGATSWRAWSRWPAAPPPRKLLIGAIAASPAAAAIVPEDDKRLTARNQTLVGGYKAYVAEPRTRSLKPTILVVHENRGLNAHTRDVARRLALANFRAVAVDFLSPSGGTPSNEDAAREAIGKLDLGAATAAGVAMLGELAKSSRGGKVGAVGFCWGGAYVNRLAVAAGDALDAGVVYYGPAPDPSEAAKVQAPLTIHLAGLDDRVAQTAFPWITRAPRRGQAASPISTMKGSTTPSTTTRRRSATTRPRRTSPGNAR